MILVIHLELLMRNSNKSFTLSSSKQPNMCILGMHVLSYTPPLYHHILKSSKFKIKLEQIKYISPLKDLMDILKLYCQMSSCGWNFDQN